MATPFSVTSKVKRQRNRIISRVHKVTKNASSLKMWRRDFSSCQTEQLAALSLFYIVYSSFSYNIREFSFVFIFYTRCLCRLPWRNVSEDRTVIEWPKFSDLYIWNFRNAKEQEHREDWIFTDRQTYRLTNQPTNNQTSSMIQDVSWLMWTQMVIHCPSFKEVNH